MRAAASSRKPWPSLTLVVPFGNLEAVERVLVENPGEVAGMIVEPIMMNIGMIPPPPGYLQALKDLLHAHGAYLTFDEVKTGFGVAAGRGHRAVRRHARPGLRGQGDGRRSALRRHRRASRRSWT